VHNKNLLAGLLITRFILVIYRERMLPLESPTIVRQVRLIGTRDKIADPELWRSGCRALRWGWAMTSAFVSHLSRFFPYCNDEKYQDSRGVPSSPELNLAGTVPQGMTFRPCCLDSSRAVFPTFWWGGIWLWASANAILFRSPYYHIRFSRALHPFSLFFAHRVHRPHKHILVLRFPLIAIPQFVWIRRIQYGI